MKKVYLQHVTKDKKLIEAVFTPSHGMNLLSLKKDGHELIDQGTLPDFEKRFGGLGPLIGPHFYHRKKEDVPAINDLSIFPHIQNLTPSQMKDPLSHGIGRYSSWNFSETSTSITGHLSGLDTQKNTTLASLEGFNFKMDFSAKLTGTGLDITYHVISDNHPSTIGLHYYFYLPEKKGYVSIPCKPKYNDMGVWKDIPKKWLNNEGSLWFNLNEESDYGFLPDNDNNTGSAVLHTPSHDIKISYKSHSAENAFQLYHPKDASFVCIEPVSAKNPRAPSGTDHKLQVTIDIA